MKRKKVLVFTGNRAEYGLQLPVIKALNESSKIDCKLIVSGSHLEKKFGETIKQIKKDKLKIAAKIKLNNYFNSRIKTPNLIGQGVLKYSRIIDKINPDIFLVNADRFETFAATIASSQLGIPTFHIEGGDITEGGTFDDNVRHAITKLSHFHFVTNNVSYKNLINMGEEKWRIHNVGLSINDLVYNQKFINYRELKIKFDLKDNSPILILTQHPVTTEPYLSKTYIKIILQSIKYFIEKYNCQVIATYPNNDVGSEEIIQELKKFNKKYSDFKLYKSLGNHIFHSLLNLCKNKNVLLLGNSSSGIKEAVIFRCPVLNIGSRQNGRLKPKNVIDVQCDYNSINSKIKKCLFDKNFKKNLKKVKNPYYKKNTGKQITKIIENIELNKKLFQKKFNWYMKKY
jgi:UDP-hydrolysing UDP-N-acetyl-D-glucosamine 2-epimerase